MVYYEYDYKRRPTKVTVNGTTTEYAYDDENGITAATFAGHTFTTKKNKDGNVVKTEADGAVQLEYTYANGLLKSIDDNVTGETANYEYNVNKAVSKISSAEITEVYNYNDRNEIISKAYGGTISQVYGYTYRNNAARDIEYITMPNGLSSYPLKDLNGRNTGKELYNGENKVYGEYISYRKVGDHATNMPSAIWYANGKEIKDNVKYKYDTCGNITEIKENGALAVRYTYDSLNRLVREDNKKFGKTYLYEYDGNGNIITKRQTGYTLKNEIEESEFTVIEYGYDGDKLITYNGEESEYTPMGRPEKYRGKTAKWTWGRLSEIDGTPFRYDGFGRRVRKGKINCKYDGEGRIIKQSNGIEFVYDISGITGFKHNEKQYFYRKDVQGNITAILDSDGNTVVKYTYDAWGNHTVTGDETLGELNPFRYRGYYYDTETGLYYLQTRYYDPEVGRFISQDGIEYADPEHINGLNLYAYCGNNPVMNIDPTGHFLLATLLIGCFIGVAIGVAGSVISQGLTNGWNNINWWQVAFDGLIGGLTGLIGGSGIGLIGSIVAGGVLGFIGSVGGDLISNAGDFSKVNWGKAAVMTFIGIVTGAIAGAGAGNVKAMNTSINAGKSWGSKAFVDFGVSIADKGASQLARQTAALYLSNAILGYKFQALTSVFMGLIVSISANGLMTEFWR